MKLAAALAVALLATAACSSGGDKKVSTTQTTSRTTTSATDDSTTTSDGDTTTSAAPSTATTRTRSTVAPTTGATAAPVDKPAIRQVGTLSKPVAFAQRANDGAVYIAQQSGKILRLGINGDGNLQAIGTTLDLSSDISTGNEQGLLGFDFSPDGSKLYASYTNTDGDTRVVEYPFANGTANKAAARTVLAVDQPYSNHNGGQITFGPDNMLYIGLGDGGSAGDPENHAQDLTTLLGKMLRINPAPNGASPYSIPAGNPFAGQSGKRGEIWHYGLRNPWRWSFDRTNGELWIGDVGQDACEEIDHVAAGRNAVNFGWRLREGNHAYNGGAKPSGAEDPVYELSHADGNRAVTGGYVYRGAAVRGLAGTYIFGDFAKGRLLAMDGTGVHDLGLKVGQLASFGEDANGELWVLSLAGGVYRLVPA